FPPSSLLAGQALDARRRIVSCTMYGHCHNLISDLIRFLFQRVVTCATGELCLQESHAPAGLTLAINARRAAAGAFALQQSASRLCNGLGWNADRRLCSLNACHHNHPPISASVNSLSSLAYSARTEVRMWDIRTGSWASAARNAAFIAMLRMLPPATL